MGREELYLYLKAVACRCEQASVRIGLWSMY